MCGICGVVKKRSGIYAADYVQPMEKVFKKMFLLSKERGTSSAGMILVKNNSLLSSKVSKANVYMLKKPGSSDTFMESPEFVELMKKHDKDCYILLGHTRAATSGRASDNRNNHPFFCGRILGIHNGIITNWRDLAKEYKIKLKSECDSEIIFAMIDYFLSSGKDIVSSIKAMAGVVHGSMACAVVDTSNPDKVFLFRRDAPLYVGMLKTGNLLSFASDQTYIQKAVTPEESKNFRVVDMGVGLLDNDCGIEIDSFGDYYWIEKAVTFSLTTKEGK